MPLSRHRGSALLSTAAVVVALTGCAGESPDRIAERAAVISVVEDEELGEILVDGRGSVLYIFVPDDASVVSCTFTCASNWPPLVAVEEPPAAAEGVDASLIATLPNPAGGEVITYNGWPLYRYADDRRPGEHRGQDLYLNGGVWLVMQPDGEPREP